MCTSRTLGHKRVPWILAMLLAVIATTAVSGCLSASSEPSVQPVGTACPKPVYSIAFSPDGKALAAGTDEVRVWNVRDGMLLRTLGLSAQWVRSVSFSPDAKTIAAGALDGTARRDAGRMRAGGGRPSDRRSVRLPAGGPSVGHQGRRGMAIPSAPRTAAPRQTLPCR